MTKTQLAAQCQALAAEIQNLSNPTSDQLEEIESSIDALSECIGDVQMELSEESEESEEEEDDEE